MNYFLTSARLGFRCWTSDDLSLAIHLWGNPEVTSLIGGPFSADSIRARLAHEVAQQSDHGLQYWPAFLLDSNRFAGCAGLRPYGEEPRVFELGIHLLPSFWGSGLATEAARAMIDYGFGPLNAKALVAGHHPRNEASKKILLKLGFSFTGAELYAPTGLLHPMYRFSNPQSNAQ
jgi:RimJ/RimL family protein N-acetyltransferase